VEVTGHKAHGAVPEPGCIVLARVSFCAQHNFFFLSFIHVCHIWLPFIPIGDDCVDCWVLGIVKFSCCGVCGR